MKLWPYLFAIPVIGIIADQLSKWWVLNFFNTNYNIAKDVCADPSFRAMKHEVITGFDLTLMCNRGISWGLMQGGGELKRWALTLLAFGVGAFLIYVIRKGTDRLTALALSFILTGAIGNAIDRLRFGAVVDFIDVSDIGTEKFYFGYIFNVADSFITVGVIILLYTAFFGPEAKAERAAKKAAKGG